MHIRCRDTRRIVTTALLIAAALALCTGAGAHVRATFTDATGDSGAAPDLSNIQVTNNDAGTIAFQVGFGNRAPTLQDGDFVEVLLDTDRNLATGQTGFGWDYLVNVRRQSGTRTISSCRWGGSAWDCPGWDPPTFRAAPAGTTYGFTINRSDLGGIAGFNFAVISRNGTASDRAPNVGQWPYDITLSTADRDSDGVPDAADACLTTPGGRYDRNRNGCPGPFSRILADVTASYASTGSGARFFTLGLRRLPAGTRVRLSCGACGVQETATASGSFRSRRMARRTVRAGAVILLRATKAGSIGYYARIRVRARGLAVTERCLPATGPSTPTPCGRVDRGR